MKTVLMTLLYMLPMLICLGAGAYLAWLGRDGYGWFLFLAVLAAPSSEAMDRCWHRDN